MERRKNIIYGLVLWSFLLSLLVSLPCQASADSDEVVIERYPDEAIFRLENMKPGDFAYRTLTIQNNHDRNIIYTMQLENQGDITLYNELLLQITFMDEIVFYGKLKDYKGINDRLLIAETEEMVKFELKFPEELGNEYQGLRAEFILDFTARAADESGTVAGVITELSNPIKGTNGLGGKLPATATNTVLYLIMGISLVVLGGIVSRLSGRKREVNKT